MRVAAAGLVAALSMSMWAGQANAAVILDTGTPAPSTGGGVGFNQFQWLAGRVVLGSDAVLSGIETYLNIATPGDFRISVYSDDRTRVGSLVYSATATTALQREAGWMGASGLNWGLVAGAYWIAIEADAVGISGWVLNAPSPLGVHAFKDIPGDRPWLNQPGFNLAFRVYGEGGGPVTSPALPVSGIPEPSTWAMLIVGFGLAGAGLRAGRRQRLPSHAVGY